jgi:molybdopterin molybdotransferase
MSPVPNLCVCAEMLDVEQAVARVLEQAERLPATRIAASDALDCVLAEDVASPVDSPAFDKALMDGYAVVAADLAHGEAVLRVVEQVTAGRVPQHPIRPGTAAQIMTGAMLPEGADAVAVVERSERVDGEHVRIRDTLAPGRNIMPRGASIRRGGRVLAAGSLMRPIEIGLLAELGCHWVSVTRRPRVAVLATGDELVDAQAAPAAGQIRNSNGPMLLAAIAQAGGVPLDLGIARDRRDELAERIESGLAADVLVLSGGVSAGVLDLVPEVLAAAGVRQVFHKVRLKPGKPLWFGVRGRPAADGRSDPVPPSPAEQTLVFGLPGNPVSSLVCFELFVRPAVRRLAGREPPCAPRPMANLSVPFLHRGDRPTYHPGRLTNGHERPSVEPLAWQGSADLATLARCDGLIHFPAGDRQYTAGELVEFVPLRWG